MRSGLLSLGHPSETTRLRVALAIVSVMGIFTSTPKRLAVRFSLLNRFPMRFVLPVLIVVGLLAAVLVKPPHMFLILGILSVSAATVFTRTGKVWVRFNGWVYRAKEPGSFWGEVAAYFLVGLCFVGYFLYEIHGF